jgi:hypothetical protein
MSAEAMEPERVMLRKWCEWAAERGGSFAIENKWVGGIGSYWATIYTINWPNTPEGARAAASIGERGAG